MKQTLTKQLEEAKKSAEYYKGKYEVIDEEFRALKKRYDDKFASQYSGLMENNREIFNANQQLQEIIRWHVNPETANKENDICKSCGALKSQGHRMNCPTLRF